MCVQTRGIVVLFANKCVVLVDDLSVFSFNLGCVILLFMPGLGIPPLG